MSAHGKLGQQRTTNAKASPQVVHIIESLTPDDILSGREEGEALRRVLEQVGLGCRYYRVVSGQTFIKALVKVGEGHVRGQLPVVHISAHGSEAGFALTDGTRLTWEDFGKICQILNPQLDSKLILCMSSCHGHEAYRAISKSSDDSFHALVGPKGTISVPDSLIGFATFYHHMAKNTPIHGAVSAMGAATGLAPGTFVHTSGDALRASHRQRETAEKFRAALETFAAAIAAQAKRGT
ncbi:MAG: hypothetical protein IPI67_26690 [Myxococcales bacterium]|nr:hypothetical protein [Myxococcales bacterium]